MFQGPYYHYHPDSPGYLEAKLETGQIISRADAARVFAANKDYKWPGDLHKIFSQIISDTFRETPGPKSDRLSWAQSEIVKQLVYLEREDVLSRRAMPSYERCRANLSPMDEACENVARAWKLGSGRTLQNKLSSCKYAKILVIAVVSKP